MAAWTQCFPLCISFLYSTLYSRSCCEVICTSIQQRGRRQFPPPPHMPLHSVYISISATRGCSWCCRVTRHQIRDNAAADGWIPLRKLREEEAMVKAVIKHLIGENCCEDRIADMLYLLSTRIKLLISIRIRFRLFTVM
jgi:hypothetical protein